MIFKEFRSINCANFNFSKGPNEPIEIKSQNIPERFRKSLELSDIFVDDVQKLPLPNSGFISRQSGDPEAKSKAKRASFYNGT